MTYTTNVSDQPLDIIRSLECDGETLAGRRFRRAFNEIDALQGRVRELENVLRELVRLKDIHDALERKAPDSGGSEEFYARLALLRDDYTRHKPVAWFAARNVLTGRDSA